MIDMGEAVYMLGLFAFQEPVCYLLPLLRANVCCQSTVWMPRCILLLGILLHMPCWDGVGGSNTP